MRVIGIDPGISHTGFGIVDAPGGERFQALASGVIRTDAKLAFVERISHLHRELVGLFQRWQPDHMAIESVFFARDPRSALLLGHARGVVVLSAALAGIEVFEYSATEIKKAVCAYGHAGKPQVQAMVKTLLRLDKGVTNHAADALAASICHIHSYRSPLPKVVASRCGPAPARGQQGPGRARAL